VIVEVLGEDAFRAAVQSEVRRCLRYSTVCSIFSVDFTNSDAAEALIEHAARMCETFLRASDVLGRIKGARLRVLAVNAEAVAAQLIMDRIRNRLREDSQYHDWMQETVEPVFRGATFPTTALDAETIFRQLGVREPWDEDDDDESPGPAGVWARI
jgi:GGDEF domain-containing protein